MDRRCFLKAGMQGSLAGTLLGAAGSVSYGADRPATGNVSSAIARYSPMEHRRRQENIAFARRAIGGSMRQHVVGDCLPAQCCYNLGEYPATQPWTLGRYDEEELDRLKEHGIELIQLFDDWADPLRLFGGDKYTPADPAAMRRFVEMAHRRGMKVLPYASCCFLERSNPGFRQEWSREGDNLVVGYWNMARCSPASPGWRAFLLPRLARILDEYGADGIYIDGGYRTNARKGVETPAKDEVVAFEETPEVDGAFADLLAVIYAEVKRRGGIMKLHVNGADAPQTNGLKVYDYLWVGEGVSNTDAMRQAVKNYPPYVVPCIDMNFAKVANQDEFYLHAIPYMQFPILQAGKPVTGQRGAVPGVSYPRGEDDFWVKRCRQIREQYALHPDGPYTYNVWDAVPGDPATRPMHARWLARYKPLVEEGTWAWLEIGSSTLFGGPLPEGVVASAFVNREFYLVLANYGQQPAQVETSESYRASDGAPTASSKAWSLPKRSLTILRRDV